MAASYSGLDVPFAFQDFNKLCSGNRGQLWHRLHGNQMKTYVFLFGWRDFFVFEAQKCCLLNIFKSLFHCFSFAVAAFKSEVRYRVPAPLFLL